MNQEFARHVEHSIPGVVLVLMALRSHHHLGYAVPRIELLSVVVQTNQPVVWSWPEREHRKRVTKVVLAHSQLQAVFRPCPDELVVTVIESDAVMAVADCLVDFNGETDGSRRDFRQKMGIISARLDDFPAQESRLGSLPVNPRMAVRVPSRHS